MSANQSDIQFVDGLIVKPPCEGAPDFVKCSLSVKREQLIAWLQAREGEWVNLDVKEARSGKWYCAVNDWKPKESQPSRPVKGCPQPDQGNAGDFEDDEIPF